MEQESRSDPTLTRSVLGTDDPREVACALDSFCASHLGCALRRVFLCEISVGAAFGLLLGDGRRAFLKANPPGRRPDFLRAVHRAQDHLARRGFPCPRPLVGPEPLLAGHATVDEYVDAGSFRDAHDPAVRREMARALSRQVSLCSDLSGVEALAEGGMRWPRGPEGGLWPEPHNALFDFGATAGGAGWIDEIGVAAPFRENRTPRVRSVCASPHLYADPQGVVSPCAPHDVVGRLGGPPVRRSTRDPASEVRRGNLATRCGTHGPTSADGWSGEIPGPSPATARKRCPRPRWMPTPTGAYPAGGARMARLAWRGYAAGGDTGGSDGRQLHGTRGVSRGRRGVGVRRAVPWLVRLLAASGALFLALLALYGLAGGPASALLGERGFVNVGAALLAVSTASSGLLLWDEWRRDRPEDSEYGEWTNRQLLYALVFAFGLFLGLAYFLPGVVFG